jgi:hypothetical protein
LSCCYEQFTVASGRVDIISEPGFGALWKQISWDINAEDGDVAYPSKADDQDPAGILNRSMSADSDNRNFQYTARIARDIGYPPPKS